VLEGVDGDELAANHKEGMDEQRGHVQTHCPLVHHQTFVFIELLLESSERIRQEKR
jgi:hypothetical protein